MTLGKRLASLRKQRGLTQQQLGDQLNLSAQAVSKWENDLAEPDLMTLRALSSLYKLTIDELTNISEDAGAPLSSEEDSAQKQSQAEAASHEPKTLGFCKRCGVAITEENLGTREPFMKCKKCKLIEREEEEKAKKEKILRAEAEAKAKAEAFASEQNKVRHIRNRSFFWGALAAIAFFVIAIIVAVNISSFIPALVGIVGGVVVFMFVAMLFYDAPVANVVEYLCSASITWPGLIFTFDLDGFAWLIKMKILFAVLGFFFGLFCSILGIALGLVLAPFVFPFIMIRIKRDIQNGTVKDYMEPVF